MTPVEEEKSIFYLVAAHDLQECNQTLLSISSNLSKEQRHSLIKYAVICFIRPFKKNIGNHERYKLRASDYYNAEDIETYNYFCEIRDKLIAHSDLNYLNNEYLSPAAMGVGLELNEEDYKNITDELLRLSQKVFNQLAQQIDKNLKDTPPKLDTRFQL